MGLTIHWHLKFKGKDTEVVEKLQKIGIIAKDLGFRDVSKMWFLDYSKNFNDETENQLRAGEKDKDMYRWAKIQSQDYNDIDRPHLKKGYVISCWAGAGCEPTNIGLTSKDGENWVGHGFTKTQYAEEFVKCHLLVISLLKFCETMGIVENVSDEGDYWETGDIETLAKNINASTSMIESMSNLLKKISNNIGCEVECNIDKSKNIVKVKGKNEKFEKPIKSRIAKTID